MRLIIRSTCLLLLLFVSFSVFAEKVIILNLRGPIGPAAQDYVERGIAYAKKENAALIILELNTPGGLDSSMRGINTAIIASPIPVVAYVSPAGAHAASAGVFILYASHLAAMAPGTNTGAASPISLTGSAQTSSSIEEKKATNDAAAYIRSLAELRNRNANWAESAVRQASSLSAQEAKQLKVIDVIADNYPDLIKKIQNDKTLINGILQPIQLSHIQFESMPTDWRYDFLSLITNPTIIYLLILLTIYGIFFELSNPGLVLPGVCGVIALFLTLYALQLIPISYAGLALIIIGTLFMVVELTISSFGIIGVGGLISFLLGSILLFDTHEEAYHLSWLFISAMGILTFAFMSLIVHLAIAAHRKSVLSGREGLIGQRGYVLSIVHQQITVRVAGEIWAAQSIHPLQVDQQIKVSAVEGLTLIIEPVHSIAKSGE